MAGFDFNNVRNYLGNFSRNFWLALGLIVVAALLAVAFLYGETDEVANQNDRDQAAEEQTVNGDGDEETAADETEQNGDNGANDADNDVINNGTVAETGGNANVDDGEALPRELADTGPVVPALAVGALAATGYLYRRSSNELKEKQAK